MIIMSADHLLAYLDRLTKILEFTYVDQEPDKFLRGRVREEIEKVLNLLSPKE